jgi:nitrate reductase assembly molybdenum cofactor insertion protein NarJ
MAKLKATQNALHMLPGSELPDHLTQMLRLLAQLQPVQAAPLIEECLLPGLVSILAGLESVQHPYRVFFEGLKKMLVAQKKALEVVHA